MNCAPFSSFSAVGTVVGSVSAISPLNHTLEYRLVPSGSAYPPLWVQRDGVVVVDGVVDFESLASPVLSVVVAADEVSTSGPFCASSISILVNVTVIDVPEPPVFVPVPGAGAVLEEAEASTVVDLLVLVTAVDPFAPNTSLVAVTVTGVVLVVEENGVLVSHHTSVPCFGVVAAGDSASARGTSSCRGGVACTLALLPLAPRLDFDAGLRMVLVTITATGATGLAVDATISLSVNGVNEGLRVSLRLLLMLVWDAPLTASYWS